MKKIYLLGFCFAIFFKMVSAQDIDKKTISVNFQQASIEQFVTDLEAKTGLHFYYNPPQFDSLKVTVQATDKPLDMVLGMAFRNTDFHYAITSQAVFLTKGRQLNTTLAPGFFNTPTTTAPVAAVTDYTEEKQTKVPEATTENKLYEIGIKTNNIKAGNATLAGYVRNIKTGKLSLAPAFITRIASWEYRRTSSVISRSRCRAEGRC